MGQAQRSTNPIRRVYEWVLSWADSPHGTLALFVIAFAEASVFPIPPDVLLIALAIAAPTRAFRYALWCTAGSVLGGLAGYAIGAVMWEGVFEPLLLNRLFPAEKFERVMQTYRDYGAVAVFVAGFTPVPYKVFTIAGGVAHIDLGVFFGASLVGRGARFFAVAGLIRALGPRAKEFIDRYFNVLTLVGTLLMVGGFLLLRM